MGDVISQEQRTDGRVHDPWPTDLNCVPRDKPPKTIISTKIEVDTIIRLFVAEFFAADTLSGLVTLIFELMILEIGHMWRVT